MTTDLAQVPVGKAPTTTRALPHPFIAADVLPKMQAIRWLDVAEVFIL